MRELTEFLASIDLFEGLDPADLEELADQFEVDHVLADTTIVEEGEVGDCLYLVDSGRLRVSVRVDGADLVLRELSRGEVIGEMALLGNQPRSATVRAVRDSQLLRLDARSFAELVAERPSVLIQVARLLMARLMSANAPKAPASGAPRAVTLCPAGSTGRVVHAAALHLAEELGRAASVRHLDRAGVDRALGPGTAASTPGAPGWGRLISWLNALEREHAHVLYETEPGPSAWTQTCLRQADLVLMVGSTGDDPAPGAVESVMEDPDRSARRELVLVHPAGTVRPVGTADWLRSRDAARHHHLVSGSGADMARLARVIRGEAYGLVLGGGGPRGFAHLGVIRALEECGVPVDFVGGTSIGAMIGATVAAGMTHAERTERVVRQVTGSGRLLDVTLPILSVASAAKITRLLSSRSAFGSLQIEDLPRPFFCVSADLSTASEMVHESGDVWRAVRASLSMPGVFPPVYDEGRLLVDGAVLNNLPVDLMRDRVGSGTVIAVDLLPEVEQMATAPFEPDLSGWRALGRRLRRRHGPPAVPSILDVMSRSSALAGIRAQRQVLSVHPVDLYLRPPMFRIGSFDFDAALPLIDMAYRATLSALESEDWKGHQTKGSSRL